MPRYFENEHGVYTETMTDIPVPDGWTEVAQQQPTIVQSELRPLDRWAFMRTLERLEFYDPIDALIRALPEVTAEEIRAKDIALGKWENDTIFSADDPTMVTLSAQAEILVPGFVFATVWAAGEALQYGD